MHGYSWVLILASYVANSDEDIFYAGVRFKSFHYQANTKFSNMGFYSWLMCYYFTPKRSHGGGHDLPNSSLLLMINPSSFSLR